MEINQEITEKIEKYLQGLMNDEEKNDFEIEISNDDELRKEVEQLSFVINSIEQYGDTELKKKLDRIHNNINNYQPFLVKLIVNNKVLAIAASVIIIISMYFTIDQVSKSMFNSERVYLTYYSTPVYNQITRNASENSVHQAEVLYNQKEYEKAYEMFNKLSVQDAEDLSNFFYMAICLHETGNDSLAIKQLENIIESEHPALTDDALWYTALIYIKQNKTNDAKKYLDKLTSDKSSFYHYNAEEILGLRRFSE